MAPTTSTTPYDLLDGISSDDGVTLVSDDSPEHIAQVLGVTLESDRKTPAAVEPVVPVEPAVPAVEPAVAATPAVAPVAAGPAPVAAVKPAEDESAKRLARAHFELRRAEEREREEARRADAFERELETLRAEPARVEPVVPAEPPPVFPSWDAWTLTHPDKGYEDYLDVRGDWRAEQRGYVSRAEVEQLADTRAQALFAEHQASAKAREDAIAEEARNTEFFAARDEAKTKHPDYVSVVEETDLPLNRTMREFVKRSGQVAGELMYELGKNPDECRRIALLRIPAEVISAMTRLQVRIESTAREPATDMPVISRAPLPVEPVSGARAAASVPLDKLDLHDFMQRRNDHERSAAARY